MEINTSKIYRIGSDLSKEKLSEVLVDYVNDLSLLSEYVNSTAVSILDVIYKVYFKYQDLGKFIAEVLNDCKYPALVAKILGSFELDILESHNAKVLTFYTIHGCINLTDASMVFAKSLFDAGVAKFMFKNISKQRYLDNMNIGDVADIVDASLDILLNISKVPEVRNEYRELNAVKLLLPFADSTDNARKATSMMTLCTILDDDENAAIEDSGAIPFMVQCIKEALASSDRTHDGFHPTELAEGLGRMAVNDSNKMTIVEAEALPLFIKMMNDDDLEEQAAATKAIWTLAFDKSARERIRAEDGCVAALEALQKSEDPTVKRHADGALWVIMEKNNEQTESSDQKNHVFISYSWNNQQKCIAIKNKLQSDGYRVWMDVEEMSGSTLEAMALAVENAAVVLVCACEKYKLSPSCRTEAEYTYKKEKKFIPLMMQRYYQADGWLGIMMGAKLYVNFDGKYAFDKAYDMLLKEMGNLGRTEIVQSQLIAAVTAPVDSAPPVAPPPGESETKPAERTTVKATTKSSTSHHPLTMKSDCDDVSNWLTENDLERLRSVFSDYNGRLLFSLRQLQLSAPDHFYTRLKDELRLNLIDTLDFTDALNKLPTSGSDDRENRVNKTYICTIL